jgi:membrane-associated PAP2 superfamily phosphatase
LAATAAGLPAAFYARQLLWLLLLGAVLWWLEAATRLDVTLAQWFFDPFSQRFPLQHSLWLEWLNHRLPKYALIAASGGLALRAVRRREARLGYAVLVMWLATLAVSLLKAHSAHSCPWDLQAFGGSGEWFALFGTVAAEPGPGQCFPGGHASGGFALLALFFYWRPHAPRRARQAVAAALAGLLMGLADGAARTSCRTTCGAAGWCGWWRCCCLPPSTWAVPPVPQKVPASYPA